LKGYYERYEDTIHAFFHRNCFSLELANSLFAPSSQLHPTLRQCSKSVDDSETSVPEDLLFQRNDDNSEDTNNQDLNPSDTDEDALQK